MILLLFLLLPLLLSFLDVPFVRQERDFCGPASLSVVLKYYGKDVSQEEIAKEVYSPKLKGALITDLRIYAQSQGFRAEVLQGDLRDIEGYTDKGIPVIILVELGGWVRSVPHYMVVVGYDDEYFIVHTGYEANRRMKKEDLDKVWKRMGRVMLVVYPPN